MKTTLLTTLLAALTLGSGATFAGSADASTDVSGKLYAMHDAKHAGATTRADVLRDLEAWRKNPVTHDGYLTVGTEIGSYVGLPDASQGKTRAQVVRELAEWRRNPVTADGWREVGGDGGYAYVGNTGSSGKTREDVRRELAEWRSNPVTADGWREVGGDGGYAYVGQPGAGLASTQAAMPRSTNEQHAC